MEHEPKSEPKELVICRDSAIKAISENISNALEAVSLPARDSRAPHAGMLTYVNTPAILRSPYG